MKKWRLWFVAALLFCVPILLSHSTDASLLTDTDTAALLQGIRARQQPLSWFAGDWPLQNHFYRPLPTLTFELDNALHPNDPVGYGWTSAILAALCALALFWFVRELTDNPPTAFAGTAIFALWSLDKGALLYLPLICAGAAVPVLGFLRHGLKAGRYLPAAFLLVFLASEVVGMQPLWSRIVGWLPGRTASVMTLFTLLSMAAYARYERVSAVREPVAPTATDRPTATKSTEIQAKSRQPALWLFVSVISTVLAFASYEQAVMLPACLLGVAVSLRLQRHQVRWKWHVVFWLILVAYLVVRHQVLPGDASRYQAQQFRTGSGVCIDLLIYLVPNAFQLIPLWNNIQSGWEIMFSAQPYTYIVNIISTVVAAKEAKRQWVLILTGWALSFLAFLPMAWLKTFEHYHYWPMALRTVFVVGIARVAWELVSIAVCPPELRAPPRLSPARGSLPRQ